MLLQLPHKADVVNCNDELAKILGIKTFKMTDIPSLVTPFLKAEEPLTLQYTVK